MIDLRFLFARMFRHFTETNLKFFKSAADLTHKVYYINSSIVPSLAWVELNDLDFRKGRPVLFLNPHNPKLGGDLDKKFKKWRGQP